MTSKDTEVSLPVTEFPECREINVHVHAEVSQLAVQSFSMYEGLLDTDFTAEDVATAVVRLKAGKAPGPDGLTAEHLKAGGGRLLSHGFVPS